MNADAGMVVAGTRLELRRISSDPTAPSATDLPVLVFLHEGLGCAAQWRDFPDRVAVVLGLPAVVYSRAGYGGSDPVPLPRPVDYLDREGEIHLPALLDRLGLRRVILIGHSDGASIALIAAAADADRRVLGVVAMAPHSFVEELCLAAIAKVTTLYRETDLRARLARHHGDNVDCAFWGWNATWLDPAFKSWDIRARLAAIVAPVLVIQGEDDEYATLAQVDVVRDRVSGRVETLVLPACGHAPQRDQRAAVEAAIVGFVRSVVPVSG